MKPGLEPVVSSGRRARYEGPMNGSSILGLSLVALLLVGLGVVLALEPWPTAIAMAVLALGIPGVLLLWHFPEIGIVLLVFLGSKILHPELLDLRLPIGGGLELPDLLLLALAGLLFAKQILRLGPRLPTSRLFAPFSILMGIALFSALRAMVLMGVEVSWSFSELRGLVYFLVLLLATWQLKQREQISRLFVGLFLVALATVGIMIVQQFFGNLPLVAGQLGGGWQMIDVGGEITRIRPPAHLLLYYLSIVSFALMVFSRSMSQRMGMLALTLLLNLVLLLTFTRAQWLASALAVLACIAFMQRATKLRFASIMLGIIVLGSALFMTNISNSLRFIQDDEFVAPMLLRVNSIFSYEETLDSFSLQTRVFQTEAAMDSIAENPILGVGLGNSYRRLTSEEAQSRNARFARFMENTYLYIATKMGLPALAVVGWLIVTIIAVIHRSFKSAQDPILRGLSLASLATITGIVFWGISHPVLFLPENTLIVGLVGGVGEAIGRMNR